MAKTQSKVLGNLRAQNGWKMKVIRSQNKVYGGVEGCIGSKGINFFYKIPVKSHLKFSFI